MNYLIIKTKKGENEKEENKSYGMNFLTANPKFRSNDNEVQPRATNSQCHLQIYLIEDMK